MGIGPMSAITAGRYFHFVGLATLIVAVSFFDGGLLQRASSVTARNSISSVNLTADAVQQLPQGYTSTIVGSDGPGEAGSYGDSPANLLTPTFAAIMSDNITEQR